ncbi:MAG: diguanylate cyclase [Bryobacteraceae bacterium]
MSRLNSSARIYIGANILLGAFSLIYAAMQWDTHDIRHGAVYLLLAILASPLKVKLPGINSTMSVNYVCILVAASTLNVADAVLIAIACTLMQCLWKVRNRPRLVHLAFNITSTATATALCYAAYHLSYLGTFRQDLPIRLIFASLTYFAGNTLSVAGIVAISEGKKVGAVWKQNYAWTAPQYLVGAMIAGLVKACDRWIPWEWSLLLLPVVYVIYKSYRIYLGRVEQERKHVAEVADLHLRTIEALAVAIEAKDETTHDHLQRVQIYATEIAKDLELPEEQIRALNAAALLHDIGKLAVPEYILSKPGRLTPEEFEKVKIHPIVGAEILNRVKFPYPVVPIVAAHHEKWDGSGYPRGLKGEEIPIGARILSVIDCLDALSSDRQYRRALPLAQAMAEVASQSGISFDPRVVSALKRRYNELESLMQAASTETRRSSPPARIEHGIAPAAGFENSAPHQRAHGSNAPSFTSLIAAARQEFQTIHELTSELGTSLSLEDTLSILSARLKALVSYDAIGVYVCDGAELVPQYVSGADSALFSSLRIPMGQGLSGWVAENNKGIINGNPSVEPGYLHDPSQFSVLNSALSVPLTGPRGTIGVLTLYSRKADAFTSDHMRLLTVIGPKTALTIENALRFREAKQSATTDGLTGLPNTRSLFLHLDSEIARSARNDASLAVLVLDLDGFKAVNDRFGHLSGNKLLQAVSQALRDSCREYDYVARMGGDEFVVVMPGIQPGDLAAKIQRLQSNIARAGRLVTGEDLVGASVGAALYPADASTAEELLAEADKQMYSAKHAKKRRRFELLELPAKPAYACMTIH